MIILQWCYRETWTMMLDTIVEMMYWAIRGM